RARRDEPRPRRTALRRPMAWTAATPTPWNTPQITKVQFAPCHRPPNAMVTMTFRLREMRNVIVTMALGGLWHGANWTFVIWGVFHGVGVAAVHAMGRLRAVRRGRGSSRLAR